MPPWFEEVALTSGIDFTHDSGHRTEYYFPECVSGGVALVDIDNDGLLDAYFVQSGRITDAPGDRPGNRLFRNAGGGVFEDITNGSGADDRGYGMGVTTGDFDNDGDADLYVTNVGANVLLRNDGGGTFTDVTALTGVGDAGWGSSCAFVDVDGDGHLDLYVVNYVNWSVENELECHATSGERDYCSPKNYNAPARDVLYRNRGDGTFEDATVAAGLGAAFGNGLGIVCGDFNGDGHIDIFIANDGTPDQLWQNDGSGAFTDVASTRGCDIDQHGEAKAGMGTTAVDFDDDGDLDLLVVNLAKETDSFYRNEGDYFVDDTALIGLGQVSRPFTRFGMKVIDLDNDGALDYFVANGRVMRQPYNYADDIYAEPNLLFRGTPSGRFEEVKSRGGTVEPLIAASRGAAFGDIDNDGDIDVLITNRDGPAHLLRNVAAGDRHWIQFRVVNEHGSDALGAVITLQLGDRSITRDVRAADSYCAASDPIVHLGLGEATGVTNVIVRWPDGTTESFGDHAGDQRITLRHVAGE